MVLESEMVAGHHVAVFAGCRLRAWNMALPVFYHNSNNIPESICNLTGFNTSELSYATKTGAKGAEVPRGAESC